METVFGPCRAASPIERQIPLSQRLAMTGHRRMDRGRCACRLARGDSMSPPFAAQLKREHPRRHLNAGPAGDPDRHRLRRAHKSLPAKVRSVRCGGGPRRDHAPAGWLQFTSCGQTWRRRHRPARKEGLRGEARSRSSSGRSIARVIGQATLMSDGRAS